MLEGAILLGILAITIGCVVCAAGGGGRKNKGVGMDRWMDGGGQWELARALSPHSLTFSLSLSYYRSGVWLLGGVDTPTRFGGAAQD